MAGNGRALPWETNGSGLKGLQFWRAVGKLRGRSPNKRRPCTPMKISRSAFRGAVLTLVMINVVTAASPLVAAEPKETVLIDFTSVKRDPDGKVFRVYEYAYGDWDKHIVDLRGRGTLIQA